MCMGIPARVVESEEFFAWCEGRNGRERINMMLTGPQEPGTWILSFLGTAREVLSEDEARRIDDALNGLEAALRGDFKVEEHFPDLAERERRGQDRA